MVEIKFTGDALWTRIERAEAIVEQRFRRLVSALHCCGIPYALIGDHAVAHWVAQVDESAVRNSRDIEVILNRSDLPRAIEVLEGVGFNYRHSVGVDMFLDGPETKARDAVHVVFAGEKVQEDYKEPVPSIDDGELMPDGRTLPLEALVRMKLTSFRRKDQVHLIDMMSVGLIDETWLARVPAALCPRLQELLDDPDG